jgi:hypothetical protein
MAPGAGQESTGTDSFPEYAIVNGKLLETPPPGAGVDTVTMAIPSVPMSALVIVACNRVLLT